MKNWKVIVGGVLCVIIFFGLFFYLPYKFKRWWNYSADYENKVEATVCSMVKKEHLTEYGVKQCK